IWGAPMTTALEKPLRRRVNIGGLPYIVELSRGGVMFRLQGFRARTLASWRHVLELSEQLAGEEARRERLRGQAMQRIGRGSR
ncbi:MAG: hypothetical protein ACREFI_14925, partial [Stellaceae bacterium]